MANNMEQLESLNTHRQFFYLLSLYGCYDKKDLMDILNRSKSTIDNEISLLKYYIEEEKRELKKGKERSLTYAIPYQRYAPCENQLVNLFRQKTFTTNQINYDFLVLFALEKAQTPLSYTQILEETEKITDLSFLSKDAFLSIDGIRETVDQFLSLDFITESKEKNKKIYVVKKNLDFSSWQWERLYEVLTFFKNHLYLQSLGYFCQENIEENLFHQGKTSISPLEYPFSYKGHFPHNLLEDDLALLSMEAWEEGVKISFYYKEEGEKEKKFTVIPLKILCNLGRQYLFAFDSDTQQPLSLPLWNLQKLEKLDGKKKKQKKIPFTSKEYGNSLDLLSHSWSMTRLYLVENPLTAPIKLVELDFYPTESQRILDGAPVLWHRLQREKRGGTVKKISETHYYFSISVIEPREMIPWIRSFGAQAVLRPSKEHNLEEILQKNRQELKETYGLIPSSS